MNIVFLSASTPIVKSYELDAAGAITKHSYPFIYEFTSHAEAPATLPDLAKLMQKYAAKGNCMLKGEVARKLVKESRKGSTNPETPTDWICLDLDGIENFQSLDQFLDTIGCGDTSYIVQWSSSMGIESKTGFRCHIFMRLAKPTHPQILKHWLMDLNLTHLDAQLELTKTGNSLRWPLDITTCQNDKLLYIAPPKLGPGIKDPFPGNKRIAFHKKKREVLTTLPTVPTKDALRKRTDAKVEDLRAAAGLTKRKTTRYKFSGTTEYQVNPDSATITEMFVERGFVYFNLNGGDSRAYYHPEDNPKFIHNFKGEPVYRTEDLLPEYWAQLQAKSASFAPDSKGTIYFAFRDFRTSNYYNGMFDTATQKLTWAQAKSETQLRHFMTQHGQYLGDTIPDWNVVWDPEDKSVLDPATRRLNTYTPSPFYGQAVPKKPVPIPPTIQKVLDHVFDGEALTADHFVNWLACVVQYRTRTGTAWVLQGIQGTGKGVLFHKIITPLLGEDNVVAKRMEELESEFTGFMENKFIAFIDEIEAGTGLYHNKITAKLKNLIVEPTISIRKMYMLPYMAVNYCSMIFASNKAAAVEVAPDDRRFNVAPYQRMPLILSTAEIEDDIPRELQQFFDHLRQYKASPDRARKPIKSAARDDLINLGRTALDTVVDALKQGNMEFFWDHLVTSTMDPLRMLKYDAFKKLVFSMVQSLENKFSREDLIAMCEWCVGNTPTSPNKFTSLLKHHDLKMEQVWKNGRNQRGFEVPKWQYDPAWLAQCQQEIASGAV